MLVLLLTSLFSQHFQIQILKRANICSVNSLFLDWQGNVLGFMPCPTEYDIYINLVQPLGQKDPLEEEMATHSSILARRIPWREEPSRLQSMGSQRIGHD